MSGAFHRFTGLSNVNSSKNQARSASNIVSEPCIYKDHYESDKAFRRSLDGSCVKCDESEPRLNLDLGRIKDEYIRMALRFWSKVDITDIDDCWKYNDCKDKPTLLHFWRRPDLKNTYSHHPIRIAIWLSWGDHGNKATQSLCGERRCCNPLHNLPAGISAECIKKIDRCALQGQVDVLQQQLIEYYRRQHDKTDQQSKIDEREKFNQIIFPDNEFRVQSDSSARLALSPLQVAIDKTLHQLKEKSHSSQMIV